MSGQLSSHSPSPGMARSMRVPDVSHRYSKELQEWQTGIFSAFFSSCLTVAGLQLLAKSRQINNQARSYFNKYFFQGLCTLGLAAIFEVVALDYSPEITVSALSGTAIVFNALLKLFSASAERESYQKTGYLVLRGAFLVLVGIAVVLLSSSKVSKGRVHFLLVCTVTTSTDFVDN